MLRTFTIIKKKENRVLLSYPPANNGADRDGENDILISCKDWLNSKRLEGIEESTQHRYRRTLNTIYTWFQDNGVTSLRQINRKLMYKWANDTLDHYAPSTYNTHLTVLRSFFNYCVDEQYIDTNPTDGLKLHRKPHRPQPVASDDDVGKLLALCDLDTARGARDAAIIAMMYGCSLRRAEVTYMTTSRLFIEDGYFIVQRKGGQLFPVAMDSASKEFLENWLIFRDEINPPHDAVFLALSRSRNGHPLGVGGVDQSIRKLSQEAGIHTPTHSFRRGWAVRMAEQSAPTPHVLKQAGWTSERMYVHYTRTYTPATNVEQYSTMQRHKVQETEPEPEQLAFDFESLS